MLPRLILMLMILVFSPLFGERRITPERPLPAASAAHLPRWRGFNLLEKIYAREQQPFREEDFRWIAALGFNFVRLPMDYRCWIKNDDWHQINEDALTEIDQAVAWGGRYGIHVCLNFHYAPGYRINRPEEPRDLWTDPEAQAVCARYWAMFAKRYKGIPNSELSFNLINEPHGVETSAYLRVMKILVSAIRAEDPRRLIIADSNASGPVPELVPLGVAESTRGYWPMGVSHYRAPWIPGSSDIPVPQWPRLHVSTSAATAAHKRTYDDRDWLKGICIRPWQELERRGTGVAVGEWGAYNQTPHDVALRWMKDCLENWQEAGWGWALWNFRGPFGILDSGRSDVSYENFNGHKLDREMLELLQKY